jgi:hypothetical protein
VAVIGERHTERFYGLEGGVRATVVVLDESSEVFRHLLNDEAVRQMLG